MTKIPRKKQKIFCGANASRVAVYASAANGASAATTDLDSIQNTDYEQGWDSATISGSKLPSMQDANALHYTNTTQLAYLFQEGIAEYDSTTEYHQNSIVKKAGTYEIYGSKVDDNTGNALTSATHWEKLVDLNVSDFAQTLLDDADADAAHATLKIRKDNLIINGDFNIGQRGNSFTSLGGGAYTLDRWRFGGNGVTAGTYTIGKESLSGVSGIPEHIRSELKWNQTSAPTESHAISQRIEDVFRTSGRKITVSFRARLASGTFSGALKMVQNFGSAGSTSVTTTIAASFAPNSTYQQFTATVDVPSVSGKVIGTGSFLDIFIETPSTGTWDLRIADFEVSESAGYVETLNRTSGEELGLCERYFEKTYILGTSPGTAGASGQKIYLVGAGISNATFTTDLFRVRKRVSPTMTIYSFSQGTPGKVTVDVSGSPDRSASISASDYLAHIQYIDSANPVVSSDRIFYHWAADAEL